MCDFDITYKTFGGRRNVFKFLCELGILSKECPKCHEKAKAYFLKDRSMPRLQCRCKYKGSVLNGSLFDKHAIENVPLFLFVLKCYVLRVQTKAIAGLSGSKEDTITKYLNVIRDAICKKVDETVSDPRFMFGGPNKVVEVDEAFVCHRKNHRGRPEAKEGYWVVGITEVDSATHEIDNQELLVHLKEREEARERAAEAALARRAKTKTRKRAVRVLRGPPMRVPTGGDLDVVELIDGDVHQIPAEFVPLHPLPPLQQLLQQPLPPPPLVLPLAQPLQPQQVAELEEARKALFARSRKGRPKKTMFFVVEHRDAATLEKIIGEFVIPGSTVHTDEWPGYNGLRAMGYDHHTICHKKRFSRFIFEDETATLITTNHIERLWVELRKTMKAMKIAQFEKYLNLEPYRLMNLYGTVQECVRIALRDVGEYAKK